MPDMKQYFAFTEEVAISRYEKHKSKDPFPDIPPALLSSAQIQAYIAETGMIFPYFPATDSKEERVTSASLIMTIGPEVLYWDSKNKQKYYKKLKQGDSITLRPNSITFLRPAERFNIPDYIAVRFNLRIVHVHRGLLLGTGPLIDPGFKGYPMIPVHNLTENEYIVHVGDKFINVEFTKINNIDYAINIDSDNLDNIFTYLKNRGKAFDYDFIKYIDDNVPQRKVKSSLSSVIDNANNLIGRQKRILTWSVVVGIMAIATFIYAGYQLTISTTSIMNDVGTRIDQYKEQGFILDQLQKTVHGLEKEINNLKANKTTNTSGAVNEIDQQEKRSLSEINLKKLSGD